MQFFPILHRNMFHELYFLTHFLATIVKKKYLCPKIRVRKACGLRHY